MNALAKLTPREKWLLLGGAVFVATLALWFYGWQPVAAQRDAQQDRIARYLALIDIAERSPDAAPIATPQCTNSTALPPRVTQSADAAGIVLARLDPEGQRLRITVSDTGYAGAISWISQLETQDCVRAVSIEMVRLTEPGKISLRMTLEDAGS